MDGVQPAAVWGMQQAAVDVRRYGLRDNDSTRDVLSRLFAMAAETEAGPLGALVAELSTKVRAQ